MTLVARSLWPFPLGGSRLRYPGLRWMLVHLLGDAVFYRRIAPGDVNQDVHDGLSAALGELAAEAGPDATLCVIAHSLGGVIASNHFHDLRAASGDGAATALQRGETLGFLFTLGNPMALWVASHPTSPYFDDPLRVPPPEFPSRHPALGWTNVLYREDVVGHPLQPLGGAYAERVTDKVMKVGSLLLRNNPLAHPWYWQDRAVMDLIAGSLAQFWVSQPLE
jgi:hypothetical protein